MRRLAGFAVACRDGELPEAVRADVPGRVLDVLGNCLAAYSDTTADATGDTTRDTAEAAAVVLRGVRRWGGAGEASVIGSGDRVPAPSAALVNGTLAHALDFDDTHLPSVLHPSARVVPAALAVAQSVRAPGAELVAAIAAGIEVCARLGMASYLPQERNSLFFEQGRHATSICGTLGAAVAAGLLLGLPPEGVAHAVGVAASMGAGLLEANRTGGTVKPVHCGWAAHAGVSAAVLAAEGLTGPPTVLDPARLELAGRVRCVADERASRIFPRAFAAVVRVRLRDGSTLEHRVDSSRGGPEHPLSAAELETKFRSNASRALPPGQVNELAEAVRELGSGGAADDVLTRTALRPS
ncbi:MmgE/PrpD family protein [Nonomuraea sp. FMUSA5-5]|uniref:MmgE/PrpD family protein n=1 Tax=Nonomuraea composti TaxID=2720023 RepID=A0ABX1B587_9ACTN|nr:MmgE/PrpD family protein [Nonomuraea sp. FMUSA5-5]